MVQVPKELVSPGSEMKPQVVTEVSPWGNQSTKDQQRKNDARVKDSRSQNCQPDSFRSLSGPTSGHTEQHPSPPGTPPHPSLLTTLLISWVPVRNITGIAVHHQAQVASNYIPSLRSKVEPALTHRRSRKLAAILPSALPPTHFVASAKIPARTSPQRVRASAPTRFMCSTAGDLGEQM